MSGTIILIVLVVLFMGIPILAALTSPLVGKARIEERYRDEEDEQ